MGLLFYRRIHYLLALTTSIIIIPTNALLEVSAVTPVSAIQVPIQTVDLALISITSIVSAIAGIASSHVFDSFKRLSGLGIFLFFLAWLSSYGVYDINKSGQELSLLCLPYMIFGCLQLVKGLAQWAKQKPGYEFQCPGDEDICRGCLKNPCQCGAGTGGSDNV